MSRKGRKVTRESEAVSWKEACLIAGSEKKLTAGRNYTTWQGWKADDKVPGYVLAPHLLAWYRDERGTIPPPDPFADLDAALQRGLKLMIEYYRLATNPRAFDHWVATIGGFRNGLARAARQEANADRLEIIRELLDGTAADAEVQDETA